MSKITSMPVDTDCPERTERRGFFDKLEIRKDGDNQFVEGYAAVFFDANNPDATQFRLWRDTYERILPGAFDKAISRPDDVRCLFNHDDCAIFGRTASGTLTLSVDKVGLRFSCLLADDAEASSLVSKINRKDVTGCSFGFVADAVNWREVGDQTYREITDVTLYDVGPCTYPAYSGTSTAIAQRSLTAYRESLQKDAAKQLGERRRRIRLID